MINKKKTVLVLDNDEDWLSLLGKLLSAEGYRVLKACTCAEALALAGSDVPDCVISDLKLGGEDGMAVCCAIKRSPALRHIPVILISGAEPAQTGCGCSCDAFVCKADGIELMMQTVKKALG